MDAVEIFLVRHEPGRLAGSAPSRSSHNHASYLMRSSRARISTIGTLPPCEVTSTSLRTPARATLSPISSQILDHGLPGEGDRAGRGDVLVRLADRLQRQEGRGQTVRQQLDRALHHAFADAGVGKDGQMRPVLLDGADGQDSDPVLRRPPRKSGACISCQ